MWNSKNIQLIWDFITQEDTLTLATSVNNQPYCANVIYHFDTATKVFTFKSALDTRHAQEMIAQPNIGGNILPSKKQIGTIKGLQLTGTVIAPDDAVRQQLNAQYYKAHPYARAMQGEFWHIKMQFAKLTDSKLGIGKRVKWHATNEED